MDENVPLDGAAFRLGPWIVQPQRNRLAGPNETIDLDSKTMAVLTYFASKPGAVVSADELIGAVWGGRALGDNPVYKAIARLRRALGKGGGGKVYFETIPKKGYRLVCPVTAAGEPQPSPASPAPVRRISQPVIAAIFVAGFAVIAAMLWLRPDGAPPATAHSIAVMPFTTFTPDENDAYFADGLAEEILNQLAQSPDLLVVARTSSFQFRDQTADAAAIGEALSAQYLIEGSVRRDGEILRVTAQLIEADSGYHLWSDTFDTNLEQIFSIQNDIAFAIANALDVTLQITNADDPPTRDPQAWALYLRGLDLFRRKGAGPIEESITLFEQAVARDPNFAEAYAAQSEALTVLPKYTQKNPALYVEQGRIAAEKAMALDPALPQPYLTLAAYENDRGEFSKGMALAERAYELAPQHTGVLNTMSYDYAQAGWMQDATTFARRGIAVDPLEGGEYITLGYTQMSLGDYDGARETFLTAWNKLGVKAYFLWEGIFELHILKGEFDEAEQWLAQRENQYGIEYRKALISGMRTDNPNDRDDAIALFASAARTRAMPAQVAFEYLLFLGADDLAFESAMESVARGDFFMIHHLFKPSARALQRQPRILELAKALGIADLWRETGKMPDFCNDAGPQFDCRAELDRLFAS